MPWNVPTQSGADGSPSRASMRPRISPAALLVKVTARMPCGDTFSTCTSHATRCVSTRVLPLPAPASTSVGASGAVTAWRCASFSASRRWETSMGGGIVAIRASRRVGRYPVAGAASRPAPLRPVRQASLVCSM